MKALSVEADFTKQGQALPRRLTWEGQGFTVQAIGRRWQDAAGQHLLVKVGNDRTFELLYNGAMWQGRLLNSGASDPAV